MVGPVLGIGTYGEVRTGTHRSTNKRVALKVVDLNRFRREVAEFMTKEIAILHKLNHENCIKLVEVIYDVPFQGCFCQECACTNVDVTPGSDKCRHCQHLVSGHTKSEERKVLLIVQELAAGGEMFGMLMSGKLSYVDIYIIIITLLPRDVTNQVSSLSLPPHNYPSFTYRLYTSSFSFLHSILLPLVLLFYIYVYIYFRWCSS